MKPITVLLAEDHAIVREGLRALLESNNEFEVVAEAATGREAVTHTLALRPTVVLMDIAMPELNGFEATRQILRAVPETRILVLSAYSDDSYVAQMAELGAAGYLNKQDSGRTLAQAIKVVASGQSYYSPGIGKRLQEAVERAFRRGTLNAKAERPLTSREAEVLQLVAEGAPNKRIALDLGISIKTVEKHRQQVMDKLNIHETAGLTRYAIAIGIIESSTQKSTR